MNLVTRNAYPILCPEGKLDKKLLAVARQLVEAFSDRSPSGSRVVLKRCVKIMVLVRRCFGTRGSAMARMVVAKLRLWIKTCNGVDPRPFSIRPPPLLRQRGGGAASAWPGQRPTGSTPRVVGAFWLGVERGGGDRIRRCVSQLLQLGPRRTLCVPAIAAGPASDVVRPS